MLEKQNLYWRGKMDRVNDYVTLTPIEFLKSKLDLEITLNEILLLEYLTEFYNFKEGIVNLLVEQVLKMNNNKLTRGFTLKVANEWDSCNFESLGKAQEYASAEYEKFVQLQKRNNFGEIRELTLKEKEIVNRIFYKSSLDEEILDSVISYCMKINDGYIISWFINRVIEFLISHNVTDKQEANQLLNDFHEKYVLSFGIGS